MHPTLCLNSQTSKGIWCTVTIRSLMQIFWNHDKAFFTFLFPVLYPEICYILAYAFCYRRGQFGALLQTVSPKQKPRAFSIILDILCKELTSKSIGAKLLVWRSESAATSLCYRTAWQRGKARPITHSVAEGKSLVFSGSCFLHL